MSDKEKTELEVLQEKLDAADVLNEELTNANESLTKELAEKTKEAKSLKGKVANLKGQLKKKPGGVGGAQIHDHSA